jgi:hypothetical protein
VSVASLLASATSAPVSSFMSELKTAQQQDAFLQSVGEEVDDSDHGVWRDFCRNDRVYFVISVKVTRRSVFVSHGYRAILFCMRHMETLLRGTRESLVRRLILRSFSGGPTCSETWLISFVVAARVQPLKALLGCGWGLTRSLVYLCSRSLIGVWTLLACCLSPAAAMI